ncbi:hypothetical protein HNR42_000750 [Deinobacterium chartae]|uniref:VOC domain-containing protein n=1 Tax=Deinobacterium chartae TaxID=521158 RepID=A0A841HWN7_9DEIO|nr:VOC family protein [Deinobacterium chartae]MBB6097336.1 hypothetical protein [Deinobacterium chartae]
MMYPAGQPSWTDLTTPAPEQTQAFYGALFGWQYQHTGDALGNYVIAHHGGKTAAGIMPVPVGSDMPIAWTVYFASDDIAADVQRARELGGQVLMGPEQVGEEGQMALIGDPSGASFGLWQAGAHQGAQTREQPGSVVWVELNTRDSASALAFYTALFRADSEAVDGMDYHQLKHGDQGYAGISGMAENWEAIGISEWLTYFYVPDVDEAARVAEQQGGKVLVAPFDMPYGRMAVLRDPGGASFAVMNPGPMHEA